MLVGGFILTHNPDGNDGFCFCFRVTSVNRLPFGPPDTSGNTNSGNNSSYHGEQCVIQLIPHLNLNASRLQQILQGC